MTRFKKSVHRVAGFADARLKTEDPVVNQVRERQHAADFVEVQTGDVGEIDELNAALRVFADIFFHAGEGAGENAVPAVEKTLFCEAPSERIPENVEPLFRFDASAFEFAECAVGFLRKRGARFEAGGAEYVFIFQPDTDVPDVERDGECFPHDSRPSSYLQKRR